MLNFYWFPLEIKPLQMSNERQPPKNDGNCTTGPTPTFIPQAPNYPPPPRIQKRNF